MPHVPPSLLLPPRPLFPQPPCHPHTFLCSLPPRRLMLALNPAIPFCLLLPNLPQASRRFLPCPFHLPHSPPHSTQPFSHACAAHLSAKHLFKVESDVCAPSVPLFSNAALPFTPAQRVAHMFAFAPLALFPPPPPRFREPPSVLKSLARSALLLLATHPDSSCPQYTWPPLVLSSHSPPPFLLPCQTLLHLLRLSSPVLLLPHSHYFPFCKLSLLCLRSPPSSFHRSVSRTNSPSIILLPFGTFAKPVATLLPQSTNSLRQAFLPNGCLYSSCIFRRMLTLNLPTPNTDT